MIKSAFFFYFGRKGRLFMADIIRYGDNFSVVKVRIYEILGKHTKRLDSFSASAGAFLSLNENREKNLELLAYRYTKENLDFYG